MTEKPTRAYCLQQAVWWQKTAAMHYRDKETWEPYLRLLPRKSREMIKSYQRKHRIAHATARDYLWMAECLR